MQVALERRIYTRWVSLSESNRSMLLNGTWALGKCYAMIQIGSLRFVSIDAESPANQRVTRLGFVRIPERNRHGCPKIGRILPRLRAKTDRNC